MSTTTSGSPRSIPRVGSIRLEASGSSSSAPAAMVTTLSARPFQGARPATATPTVSCSFNCNRPVIAGGSCPRRKARSRIPVPARVTEPDPDGESVCEHGPSRRDLGAEQILDLRPQEPLGHQHAITQLLAYLGPTDRLGHVAVSAVRGSEALVLCVPAQCVEEDGDDPEIAEAVE